MPKVLKPYSVTAWDESKSLLERIKPSKDVRVKYSNMFTPRRLPQPKTKRPKSHSLTADERRQLMEDWVREVAEKTLLSKLVLERHELDKRSLKDRLEAIPLEDRLSAPRPEYEVKQAPLDKLHFAKTKYLARLEEVRPVFDATMTRLAPLFEKLKVEDQREEEGLAVRVNSEVREKLWKMFNDLQDRYSEYDEKGRKWNNSKWRRLIGALKRIGRVSFEQLEERFSEICTQLAGLNLTFDDL